MTDAELRRIFDEDAQLYDRARPGYPATLFADLVELTELGPGSRVIEIGPGTGQATGSLAATGASITAVELGPQLASVLRENVRGTDVEVVNWAFEDWSPPQPVDLVTSFTAWHWVDHATRADRVIAALAPGGRLATVATDHVRGGTVEFFAQARDCYLRWDPATDPDEPFLSPAELSAITDEIDSDPRFGPAVRRRYVRDITYTADDYLAVLETYSGHRALSPESRTGLLSCLRALIEEQYGGVITKTYLHELRIAQAHHR
ncbi:MAG TPA: methyltransferase domain-containing protein [Microlunatus sp.]